MSAKGFRNLPRNNDYSLESIERDILQPANLRFKRDTNGNIADVSSTRAGVEGSLAIEVAEPEAYTPELLMAALDGAEKAEKEFGKTGIGELTINVKPLSEFAI